MLVCGKASSGSLRCQAGEPYHRNLSCLLACGWRWVPRRLQAALERHVPNTGFGMPRGAAVAAGPRLYQALLRPAGCGLAPQGTAPDGHGAQRGRLEQCVSSSGAAAPGPASNCTSTAGHPRAAARDQPLPPPHV